LIGKMEDDVVNVVTPGGEREFEVSTVEHLG
jgi:transcription elongation GreA/GreB family factor